MGQPSGYAELAVQNWLCRTGYAETDAIRFSKDLTRLHSRTRFLRIGENSSRQYLLDCLALP